MNDKEKVLQLFSELGIEVDQTVKEEEIILDITAKSSEKVMGYWGCILEFHFDKTGEFKSMGIWS